MALICSVVLFSLACNLDTLVLAMGFGLRGVHPTRGGCLTLAVVTTIITSLALLLGRLGGDLLPAPLAAKSGGLILMAIGLWMLLDCLKTVGQVQPPAPLTPVGGYLSLAAALAFNNAGAGLAAGVGGMSPLWGGCVNFAVTLCFLPLGLFWGRRLQGGVMASLALPLSGLLLLALGAAQVWL